MNKIQKNSKIPFIIDKITKKVIMIYYINKIKHFLVNY